MLRSEAPLEASARNVVAAVPATLGPPAMLAAPVVRTVIFPARVASPAAFPLPAAALMPCARFVGRASGRRGHRTRRSGEPRQPPPAAARGGGGGGADPRQPWPGPRCGDGACCGPGDPRQPEPRCCGCCWCGGPLPRQPCCASAGEAGLRAVSNTQRRNVGRDISSRIVLRNRRPNALSRALSACSHLHSSRWTEIIPSDFAASSPNDWRRRAEAP